MQPILTCFVQILHQNLVLSVKICVVICTSFTINWRFSLWKLLMEIVTRPGQGHCTNTFVITFQCAVFEVSLFIWPFTVGWIKHLLAGQWFHWHSGVCMVLWFFLFFILIWHISVTFAFQFSFVVREAIVNFCKFKFEYCYLLPNNRSTITN